MMVGHALLAFALVGAIARWIGRRPERALVLGIVAGAFAFVPDVDMVYAFSGLAAVDPAVVAANGLGGLFLLTDSFWGASTVVHRSATHSVVLAVPAAAAVGLWASERTAGRWAAVAILAGVTVAAWLASGTVDAAVVGVFGLMALSVTQAVVALTDLDTRSIAATALVGFASHPFGDLFTGEPPRLLYPFDARLLIERVEFAADPTIHLLGAFALELAVVWLALVVYLWLTGDDSSVGRDGSSSPSRNGPDLHAVGRSSTVGRLLANFGNRSPSRFVDRRATLAVGYGMAVLAFQPPTLDTSYHFVFSILLVGLVLAIPALGRPSAGRLRAAIGERYVDPETPLSLVLTGVTAVTIGWVAYLVAYLAL